MCVLGHDVNSKHASQNWSHYGGTALMMAVERGAPSLVKLFLDAKANPDIQGLFTVLCNEI